MLISLITKGIIKKAPIQLSIARPAFPPLPIREIIATTVTIVIIAPITFRACLNSSFVTSAAVLTILTRIATARAAAKAVTPKPPEPVKFRLWPDIEAFISKESIAIIVDTTSNPLFTVPISISPAVFVASTIRLIANDTPKITAPRPGKSIFSFSTV